MPDAIITDVRSLGIGIVAGIVSYYAKLAIDRYIRERTARTRKRQLEQAQSELKLLERLGSSDRALLLFGFRFLFPLLAMGSLAMVVPSYLALVRDLGNLEALVRALAWTLVCVLAVYASTVLRKLEDPQPTLKGLRERIRELEAQDGNDVHEFNKPARPTRRTGPRG